MDRARWVYGSPSAGEFEEDVLRRRKGGSSAAGRSATTGRGGVARERTVDELVVRIGLFCISVGVVEPLADITAFPRALLWSKGWGHARGGLGECAATVVGRGGCGGSFGMGVTQGHRPVCWGTASARARTSFHAAG
jgi:hypothetical protein